MNMSRLSQSLEKAHRDRTLKRSRLVASACLVGVALGASGCGSDNAERNNLINTIGPPKPGLNEPPEPPHGAGGGGGGGGGTY
jgi:hypothetical protein